MSLFVKLIGPLSVRCVRCLRVCVCACSDVASWSKINSGLIKMYQKEVWGKFPVVQHFFFGAILPFDRMAGAGTGGGGGGGGGPAAAAGRPAVALAAGSRSPAAAAAAAAARPPASAQIPAAAPAPAPAAAPKS
jgi:serine/threonine-protein phosphatase 2A activator